VGNATRLLKMHVRMAISVTVGQTFGLIAETYSDVQLLNS
jgi:hypothetical protein